MTEKSTDTTQKHRQALADAVAGLTHHGTSKYFHVTPQQLLELAASVSKVETSTVQNELLKARVDAQEWQQSAESYEKLYVSALDKVAKFQDQSKRLADQIDRQMKEIEKLREDNTRKAAYIGDMQIKVIEMGERIEKIREREKELGLPPKDL